MAKLPNTWFKSVNSSQLPTVVSFNHRTLLRLLFQVPTLVSAIGHYHLLDHGFKTAKLPSNLRQSDLTLWQFRRALKTYLFGWLRLQHLVTFCLEFTTVFTYLLTSLLWSSEISNRPKSSPIRRECSCSNCCSGSKIQTYHSYSKFLHWLSVWTNWI